MIWKKKVSLMFDYIKRLNQAGAELGEAQVKLKVVYEVIVKVGSCKCS